MFYDTCATWECNAVSGKETGRTAIVTEAEDVKTSESGGHEKEKTHL